MSPLSPEEAEELLAAARVAAEGSYSPYSHLRVGAVVVDAEGNRYPGANVENAAYPSALCSEATAIGYAVSSGVRKITTVAVISPDYPGIYPCGQCRQRMAEFETDQIVVEGPDGQPLVHSLAELLPSQFDKSALEGRY